MRAIGCAEGLGVGAAEVLGVATDGGGVGATTFLPTSAPSPLPSSGIPTHAMGWNTDGY